MRLSRDMVFAEDDADLYVEDVLLTWEQQYFSSETCPIYIAKHEGHGQLPIWFK